MRLYRSERGSSFIELALATPLLTLIAFTAVDFARAHYMSIELTNAARAGAQYGVQQVAYGASAIQTKAQAASSNISATATASESCACVSDSDGSVSGAGSCPVTCASGTHQVSFISVTTTATFTPVTRIPGIPTSIPITRTVTERYQ
jgi:Flp pilus assembly protein TadG